MQAPLPESAALGVSPLGVGLGLAVESIVALLEALVADMAELAFRPRTLALVEAEADLLPLGVVAAPLGACLPLFLPLVLVFPLPLPLGFQSPQSALPYDRFE